MCTLTTINLQTSCYDIATLTWDRYFQTEHTMGQRMRGKGNDFGKFFLVNFEIITGQEDRERGDGKRYFFNLLCQYDDGHVLRNVYARVFLRIDLITSQTFVCTGYNDR